MALFENFPYVNFHELNLDWLVKIVKELSEKYPDFEEEIKNKLNMPPVAGNIGDILANGGNGSTVWVSFQEYSIPTIIQAVDDWLDAHPEATTTVQDNSITEAKLYPDLRNKVNNLATLPAGMGVYKADYIEKSVIHSTFITGNWQVEGAEYNPNRNRYVFAFIKDNENPVIVETDDTFVFIRGKVVSAGNHMNDITYNPVTDKYYIATMNSTGQLVCMDASTLDVESVINPVGIAGEISRISYDRETNSYIIFTAISGGSNYLYRANSDFTQSELLISDFWGKAAANNYTGELDITYGQGSSMYNGHLITLFWYGFKNAPAVARLVFTDIENKKIAYTFDYQNKHRWDEAEDIINVNGQLIVISDLKTTVGFTYINTQGNTSLNHLNTFKQALTHYNFTENNTDLLDDLGTATGEDETYKYWVHFDVNPEGASGSNNIVEGININGVGYQLMKHYYSMYFRSLYDNQWNNWYDVCLRPRAKDTNILTLAEQTNSGGFMYYQYTGTDYSWLPFESSIFRYSIFEVQFIYSSRIVTVVSTDNRIIARNYYNGSSWIGWEVEGIFESTSNVLTMARMIKYGRYTIRYKGNDTTWIPNSNYVYGLFDVENMANDIIKVTAHTYNGSQFAVNMYVNNAWTGWHVYTPTT